MKKLYYASFSGLSMTSRVIRGFTRSMGTSHIGVWDPENEKLIEAWGGLRIKWGWSNFKNHTLGTEYELWTLDVPDDVYETCMNTYREWADTGHDYDWLAVIGFVLRLRRENRRGDSCSEGAIRPLAAAMGWKKTNPAFVSPADFVSIIEAAGGDGVKKAVGF